MILVLLLLALLNLVLASMTSHHEPKRFHAEPVLQGLPRMIQEKVNATKSKHETVLRQGGTGTGTGTGAGGGGGSTGGNTGSGSGTGTNATGLATTIGLAGTALILIKAGLVFFVSVTKFVLIPGAATILLLAILAGGSVFFFCAITDCQGRLGTALRPGDPSINSEAAAAPTVGPASMDSSDQMQSKSRVSMQDVFDGLISFINGLEGGIRSLDRARSVDQGVDTVGNKELKMN